MDTSKLEDTATEILKSAMDKAAQGADWLAGQVPDVVQQLLRWKLVEAVTWGLIEGFVALVLFITCVRFCKYVTKHDEWRDVGPLPLGPGIIGLLFLWGGVYNLMTILKIVVAPKVYLLEYVAHLTKS